MTDSHNPLPARLRELAEYLDDRNLPLNAALVIEAAVALEASLKDLRATWPIISALEDDHRHGNLTGRVEDAWHTYEAARKDPQ